MNILPELNKTAGLGYWDRLLSESDEAMRQLLTYDETRSRKEIVELFRHNIAIINIETASACNRTCSYCPDSIYDRKEQTLIPNNVWSRIVSNIQESGYDSQVSLNLYNEPLLDPTIFQKVAELKAISPKANVKFNSNGDLLNLNILNKLAEAGLDSLYISLHPPKGKSYKDALQLESFNKFFKRIEKPLVIAEHIPGSKIRAETQYGPITIRVMSDNWNVFGNDRAGVVVKLGKESRNSPCMRVFREITVSHKGDVFPCCQFFPDSLQSQKHILGNMLSTDMFTIYASNMAVEWRRSLFDFSYKEIPCFTCADPDNAKSDSELKRKEFLSICKR